MKTIAIPAVTLPELSVRLVSLSTPSDFTVLAGGHQEHALLTMLEGEAELILEGEALTISPAFIALINRCCVLRGTETVTAKLWIVRFTDRFASESLYKVNTSIAEMLTPKYYRFNTEPELFKIVKKLILLLDRHWRGTYSKNSGTICRITFSLLCNCLLDSSLPIEIPPNSSHSREEKVALRFLGLLTANVALHHDVNFYADKLCMTRGNLAKIMKRVTGRTPKSLIEATLLSLAKELLEQEPDSINNLSEYLGFKSCSAFINFFRLQTGLTPKEYRNRN